jgi:hypothetical protein
MREAAQLREDFTRSPVQVPDWSEAGPVDERHADALQLPPTRRAA